MEWADLVRRYLMICAGISTVAMAELKHGSGTNRDGVRIRKDTERGILEGVDVACGTLSSAHQPHLQNLRYKFLLVDEASQVSEPLTIVALCLAE